MEVIVLVINYFFIVIATTQVKAHCCLRNYFTNYNLCPWAPPLDVGLFFYKEIVTTLFELLHNIVIDFYKIWSAHI